LVARQPARWRGGVPQPYADGALCSLLSFALCPLGWSISASINYSSLGINRKRMSVLAMVP